jgi:hypothetical protein
VSISVYSCILSHHVSEMAELRNKRGVTMLHRSLVSVLAVGLMVALLTFGGVACSKSPATGQGDITITSSVSAGHSHEVTISGADIENPPAGGRTIDTTYNSGHSHTITLTQQDFETIKNGGEITVTSSSSGGHTHTFVIKK